MTAFNPEDRGRHKKLILTWSITFLVLFPLLIVLGLLMRMNQGEVIKVDNATFYSYMTLHGLGMAGVLFSMAWAAVFYLVGTRYVKLNIGLGYAVFLLVVIGSVGLAVATLIGKFAAGWYMLYPLPFIGATWKAWTTGLAIISLIIMGVAWLIGCLHVVYALSREYGGFTNLIGWQYLGKTAPEKELPPLALISTISLVPGILAFIAGAAMLVMYLLQHLEPSLSFDALVQKNLMFFFGHTLVNITMYCGVGWLYTLLPEFTGREWKLNKLTVYAWNATFFFIVFAYFHHLYMDFVQPTGLQIAGQLASYFSAIPATAVTMFGVIAQLYRSKVKWGVIPTAFLLGVAGWAIGGFAAVVDSTISINRVLHNTLWVPAHFHTYMLMGVVLLILAFLYYLGSTEKNRDLSPKAGFGFWLFVAGAYGFLLMFYLGGMESIPRRFSEYASSGIAHTHDTGALLAKVAALFVALVLIGLLMMYGALFNGLLKKDQAPAK